MRSTILSVAISIALPALLAPEANAEQMLAQEKTSTFLCAAPAGHVCQFAVLTAAASTPLEFALPSGERKEVPGITPYNAKYCVCDPGPVTPDCKAPRLDHWCMGQWLDVVPGLNSQIHSGRRFAQQ